MHLGASDVKTTLQNCFLGGEELLNWVNGIISTSVCKEKMVRHYYAANEADGSFHSLHDVWDKLFHFNCVESRHMFGVERQFQQKCFECRFEKTRNSLCYCGEPFAFYDGIHGFQEYFSSRFLLESNSDKCPRCGEVMERVLGSCNSFPKFLKVHYEPDENDTRQIEPVLHLQGKRYSLICALYYSNEHFKGRFCSVVNGQIEDTWYHYDGLVNHGAVIRCLNGSINFPLKEGDLRVQIVIYTSE